MEITLAPFPSSLPLSTLVPGIESILSTSSTQMSATLGRHRKGHIPKYLLPSYAWPLSVSTSSRYCPHHSSQSFPGYSYFVSASTNLRASGRERKPHKEPIRITALPSYPPAETAGI